MIDAFYVIWNINHGLPKAQHASQDEAVREAERLARLHPGEKFYVLGALGCACQPAPPSIYTSTRLGVFVEVPF